MKKLERSPDSFVIVIEKAAKALRQHDLDAFRPLIASAISINMDAPEPHNLLGIFCELQGDDDAARRHYRAAYALDPTYKAACSNLERLVMYEWGPKRYAYDYGDKR